MPRAKIQDVARTAAVSLSTVSAVLNSKAIVSEPTRMRVLEAIKKLHYRPDLYASNLARRQTNVFGVIISSLLNPFFAETAQAIEIEARRHGYEISLVATDFSTDFLRRAVQQMLDARVAGIAVMTSEYDQRAFDTIVAGGVPSVFLDVGKKGAMSTNIQVDMRGGMASAVKYVLSLGHRDLLFISNSAEGPSGPWLSQRLRNEGFAAAIESSGIRGIRATAVNVPGAETEAGLKAIQSVIGKKPFTAVITTTDLGAMGVYRGLYEHNLRIPDDVSVVGFDNTFISGLLGPPLTTIDIPRTELSHLAVQALLSHLNNSGAKSRMRLKTDLIVRNSTAPLR